MKAARTPSLERICAGGLAVLGWASLGIEMALTISIAHSKGDSTAAALVRYFSYFTIQTNLLLAVMLTISSVRPQADRFLTRPGLKGAAVVYIIIVCVVYYVLLRHLYDPQGLRLLADRVMHSVIPVLYPLYWFAFVPKGNVKRIDPFIWLIFPLLYFIYILVRGAISGRYPYPFFDVVELGYVQVWINALGLLAAFLWLGLIVAAIDHALGVRKRRSLTALGRAAEF